ncbi:MAG: DUF4238 domain-containing protein [Acidimicrobiia bacterium]
MSEGPSLEIRDQHLISKVLLKQWARGGVLSRVSLRFGTVQKRSPKAEGFEPWYVRGHESVRLEQVWKTTEDRVPEALAAATAGTLFQSRTNIGVIKDLLALHAVRSRQMADMWQRSLARSEHKTRIASLLELISDEEVLAAHFRARTGLEPGGSATLIAERDYLLDELELRLGRGGAGFASALEEQFQQMRDYLAVRGLEIGIAQTSELVIGDNPALTYDKDNGKIGFLQGARLGEADSFVLPLGPQHVVGGGGDNVYRELQEHAVAFLNEMQLLGSQRRVYCTPDGSGLDWVLTRRTEILATVQDSSSGEHGA